VPAKCACKFSGQKKAREINLNPMGFLFVGQILDFKLKYITLLLYTFKYLIKKYTCQDKQYSRSFGFIP
jgi:hypothetical protein